MPTTPDVCRHCGYSQPTDAATCPGCGRAHPLVRREAPRRIPVLASHLGLVEPAHQARRVLVVAGWLAAAFGLAAAVRFALSFDDVAAEFGDSTPGRVTDVTEALGWSLVLAALVAAGLLGVWARRSLANLPALHLDEDWRSAWSLGGWVLPGRGAELARRRVDRQWRDTSTAVAPLPRPTNRRTFSRVPVSQVVHRWWALWLAVPALVGVLVVLVGESFEVASNHQTLELVAVGSAALAVAVVRSAYDVVGIVTVAQAHRAEALLRDRERAEATATARPEPEPLVVVDHEWEAAGYDPKTNRNHDEDEYDETDDLDDVYDLSKFF